MPIVYNSCIWILIEKQEVNCYEGQKVEWKELEEIDGLTMLETQRYAVKAAIKLAQKT